MLQYKAERYGKEIVTVDRYFPSSQKCNVCGEISPMTKDLNVRVWKCPKCGFIHARDYNSAINLRNEGMRLLASC